MSLLAGLSALACFVLGVVGYRMSKDPGVVAVGSAYVVEAFDEPTDLVALSVETYTAKRSYQIASEYRRRVNDN